MTRTLTISSATDEWLDYLKYRKNKPNTTISTYRYILRELTTFLNNKELGNFSLQDIDNYADHIQELAAKTRRNKLYSVRSFINYLYKKNLTNIKPEQIEVPDVRGTSATYLTMKEAAQLLKAAGSVRDRAILLCFLTAGVRVSELADLDLSDIYKNTLFIKEGKGGGTRVAFINEETRASIRAYISGRGTEDGPLFQSQYGTRISRQYIARLISSYAKKSGLKKKVTPHTLRHTFSTNYLESGGRLEDLQQILGHKSIRTTMIYLHFTNERLREAYEQTMGAKNYSLAATY